ncbi:hypothetical protein [Streptomyces sp. NPDC056549]|uniref:hypothetical protein n=1 Tax=Streptomyces sp. NPDC056549 TaxID=3345864 RepID=UPI00368192F9
MAERPTTSWREGIAREADGQLYCTDIIVARRHLPGRALSESVFPLLITPEHTEMTMMLPSRFWPTSA